MARSAGRCPGLSLLGSCRWPLLAVRPLRCWPHFGLPFVAAGCCGGFSHLALPHWPLCWPFLRPFPVGALGGCSLCGFLGGLSWPRSWPWLPLALAASLWPLALPPSRALVRCSGLLRSPRPADPRTAGRWAGYCWPRESFRAVFRALVSSGRPPLATSRSLVSRAALALPLVAVPELLGRIAVSASTLLRCRRCPGGLTSHRGLNCLRSRSRVLSVCFGWGLQSRSHSMPRWHNLYKYSSIPLILVPSMIYILQPPDLVNSLPDNNPPLNRSRLTLLGPLSPQPLSARIQALPPLPLLLHPLLQPHLLHIIQ